MANDDVEAMVFKINQSVQDGHMTLNDWETDFILNIQKQSERNIPLSQKQDEILEKIWKKAIG